MAGKLQVGVCLQSHTRRWRAYLWTRVGVAGSGYEIKAGTVAELRDTVRQIAADSGPWW